MVVRSRATEVNRGTASASGERASARQVRWRKWKRPASQAAGASSSTNPLHWHSDKRPFSVYRNAHDGRPRQCWHPGVRKRYPVTTLLLKSRVDVYRRDDRAFSAADRHVRAGLNLSASPAAVAHAAFGTARLP